MNETAVTAVAPDIFQIQIPLPFALRIVNCYLVRGDVGWTVVDTGLNTAKARNAWQQALAELHIQPRQIEQIVLTHTHPDHYGLAGWLAEQCLEDGGILPPVRMSQREAELADTVWKAGTLLQEPYRRFWQQCDLPEALAAAITETTEQTRQATFPHPARHEIIDPNTAVRLGNRLTQPLLMPGHSDGQLVFYDPTDGLLLCGDHVLLKITPNISLWPHGDPHPLAAYLNSVAELAKLDVALALPGHGAVMEGVGFHGRIAEIITHHHHRLDETLATLNQPSTVYEVSQRLFNHQNLGIHEMRFAATETMAHLDYLVADGRVQCSGDSVWRFSAAR